MRVTIVAAIAANGVIGRDGGLPWRLPSDLAHFKRLTMGHTLVMGRRTWESIGRALPGRRTFVVSRRGVDAPGGVVVVDSLLEALAQARACGEEEVFFVGGAALYREGLALADRMVISWVDGEAVGDTTFPEVAWDRWHEVERVRSEPAAGDERAFSVVSYERYPS